MRIHLIWNQHNIIVVSMIPDLDGDGNLPPGMHEAEWDELAARFGTTGHRKWLLDGLHKAATALKFAGCPKLYVDGSFVTAKDTPGDFDCCWEPQGVDPAKIDPVLLDFSNARLSQKLKYRGELFPSSATADAQPPRRTFLNFFQIDKNTGKPKGIIVLDLRRLP